MFQKYCGTNSACIFSLGGVVRNVGPRLAAAAAATKEVPAKKDGGRKERKKEMKNKRSVGTGPNRFEDMHCAYCNVTLYNRIDFQNHCRSDRHQHTIMSDEGRTFFVYFISSTLNV
jgi:hypothetical protein